MWNAEKRLDEKMTKKGKKIWSNRRKGRNCAKNNKGLFTLDNYRAIIPTHEIMGVLRPYDMFWLNMLSKNSN